MPGGTGLEFCAVQIPPNNKTTDKVNNVVFTVPPAVQEMRDSTAVCATRISIFLRNSNRRRTAVSHLTSASGANNLSQRQSVGADAFVRPGRTATAATAEASMSCDLDLPKCKIWNAPQVYSTIYLSLCIIFL